MKRPDLATRTYWAAVKAVHYARITNHPGARMEALAACRNHARVSTLNPYQIAPQLWRLEKRHGAPRRVDSARITLWPDRRTVDAYVTAYERTGTLPDFHILDQKG
jgi:hypothetical protein